MTKKKAKELCILKWEYIVNNNGSYNGLLNKYPELTNLINDCAYCELYYDTKNKKLNNCAKCPIKLKTEYYNSFYDVSCQQTNHLYYAWYKKQTKENAEAILNLIKNS
jgi:hypothetical protein